MGKELTAWREEEEFITSSDWRDKYNSLSSCAGSWGGQGRRPTGRQTCSSE